MNIYIITNKVNKKQYVGLTTKTIEERFRGHKYTASRGGGFYLHSAIRKYKEDNFIIELLDTAKNLRELKEKEIFYIEKCNTYNNGYNLTKGGDFTSNSGYTIAVDAHGNTKRISMLEFIERDDLIHINKNKITIFKDGERKRVLTSEYKTKYFQLGWRSKNFGFITVKLNDGTVTKIKSEDFDKNIHTGISSGTQTYYNSELGKFESLRTDEVDLDIHYNKSKIRYLLYDNNNNLIDKALNASILHGFKQFRYLMHRTSSDCTEWILTEDIINKLKPKNRDFSLTNYKLIKEQL